MTVLTIFRPLHQRIKNYKSKKNYRKWLIAFNSSSKCLVKPGAQINQQTIVEERVRLESGANFCFSRIGRYTYSGAASLPNCSIGRFCSIAEGVRLMLFTHPTTFVSTWPGFFKTINPPTVIDHFNDSLEFAEELLCEDGYAVHIGNDVWIGQNVTIKGGVTIGDGAVIGANALVTKDVPPYAIVGGVPAKIIRYRFSGDDISFLLTVRWWDWSVDRIREFAQYFDSPESLRIAIKQSRDRAI